LLGDILSIDARYSKIADLHVTSDAKALGDDPSVQHDGMVAPGSDDLSPSGGGTSSQSKIKYIVSTAVLIIVSVASGQHRRLRHADPNCADDALVAQPARAGQTWSRTRTGGTVNVPLCRRPHGGGWSDDRSE